MPWIEVSEPYAEPPRLKARRLQPDDDASPELDGAWAELIDVAVEGETIDLGSCTTLEIRSSRLTGVRFENAANTEVDVVDSEFTGCDLSRVRFRSVATSTFDGCKLTGADLSGAEVRDVRWTGCRFALANLRMATFLRVLWSDCSIEESDLFDSSLTDVDFSGSTIDALNADRTRFERVDFRDALDMSFATLTSLNGSLFAPEQIPALAYTFATALGAGIEREPDDDELDPV